MAKINIKEKKRFYRHKRIRKKVFGTAIQPRLCVHRSLKNLQAQIIDDENGKVLLGLSTNSRKFIEKMPYRGNIKAAIVLGEILADKAQKKGIKKICFDRGGCLYHGRIKAFAEAIRTGGMEF